MSRAALYLTIIQIIAVIAATTTRAGADRDIVYSAQRYGWSGKVYKDESGDNAGPMLRDLGSYHLYRINPDGFRRTQITFGHFNDWGPRWSPDGKRIAFVRGNSDFEVRCVCVLEAATGRVERLDSIFGRSSASGVQWSPDGRTLALTIGDPDSSAKVVDLIAADGSKRRSHRLKAVKDFAWSPRGDKYVLLGADGLAEIHFKPATRPIRVLPKVKSILWLTENTLIGEPADLPGEYRHFPHELIQVSDSGRLTRRIKISAPLAGKENADELDSFETLAAGSEWHLMGKKPMSLLLCAEYDMSSGDHYGCFAVRLDSGTCRFLGEGELIGMSPNGDRIVTAEAWYGANYKEFRGGRRFGPLKLVNTRTGKARAVTPRLQRILAGDWRRRD